MSDTITFPPSDLRVAEPTAIFLGGWYTFTEAGDSIKALLFAELLKIGDEVVKYWRGDLFRDATWINEYVTGPATFFWCPRECGTHIGDDLEAVRQTVTILGGDLYCVELICDNKDNQFRPQVTEPCGGWFCKITKIGDAS